MHSPGLRGRRQLDSVAARCSRAGTHMDCSRMSLIAADWVNLLAYAAGQVRGRDSAIVHGLVRRMRKVASRVSGRQALSVEQHPAVHGVREGARGAHGASGQHGVPWSLFVRGLGRRRPPQVDEAWTKIWAVPDRLASGFALRRFTPRPCPCSLGSSRLGMREDGLPVQRQEPRSSWLEL